MSLRSSAAKCQFIRCEVNQSASVLHRKRSAFENSHYTKTSLPSCKRLFAHLDAVCKVLDLNLERFRYIQLRGKHIPRAIADQSLVQGVRSGVYRYPLVVHFDLFTWLHIVVNDHLFVATDKGSPNLN